MAAAVALLSGGLDSGVAAALYRSEPGHSLGLALFFDYGQRAALQEQRASAALADSWGVPWQRVDLPWLADLSVRHGSALVARDAPLPQGSAEHPGDAESAAAVWIPARNAVFVAIAAAFAETLGAEVVVAGFNREEAVTFSDNSERFVRASDAFLALGTRNRVRLESPTLELDKAEIVAAAARLGFSAEDFWSCYEGGAEPCGRCESCRRSRWQR